MNNPAKISVVVLCMVVCAPWLVKASGNNHGSTSIQSGQNREESSRFCPRQHRMECDKEQAELLLKNPEIRRDLNCVCELLEEIIKNEHTEPKKIDQQTEILENLLFESSESEAASTPLNHTQKPALP